MSLEKVHLRKLLQIFYAEPRQRRRLLLADIRDDLRRDAGDKSSGGDFYSPFWADAKDHVSGRSDLREQTEARIASNGGRARLYPLLMEGFLGLWNERIRWRNERFETYPESVKALLPIAELGAVVKIENVVAVRIPDGSSRVIYPYFSEEPSLPPEGARYGLWALGAARPDFRAEDFRIVDILRARYFRPNELALRGNEREVFVEQYDAVLREWRKLREEI